MIENIFEKNLWRRPLQNTEPPVERAIKASVFWKKCFQALLARIF